jgi:hypothetical protein
MNPPPNNLVRTGDVTMKSRTDDAGMFAIESQRPMFAKKIFCPRQGFSRNITSWEGPVKSCLSLGVAARASFDVKAFD